MLIVGRKKIYVSAGTSMAACGVVIETGTGLVKSSVAVL